MTWSDKKQFLPINLIILLLKKTTLQKFVQKNIYFEKFAKFVLA